MTYGNVWRSMAAVAAVAPLILATIAARSQNFVSDTQTSTPQLLMKSDNAYTYTTSQTPIEQMNLSARTSSYLATTSIGSARSTVGSPACHEGVPEYHIVARYKFKKRKGGYSRARLYCGNAAWGFRHIAAADGGKRISNFLRMAGAHLITR